mgnify:FL=1
MAKEIERKFIVDPAKLPGNLSGIDYQQGYISINDSGVTRIRIINDKAVLTIKSKTVEISRDEFEYDIPYKDALRLINLSQGEVIHKTRSVIEYENKTWEVDEFHGKNKGLWLAEIELTDEKEDFIKPNWVMEEVSKDKKYYNSYLCLHPYSIWKE